MLLLLFLVFSLWQTICFWSDTARVENGYSYVWFFVLYFTAAYISIYQIRLSSAPCLLLYVVFSLLSVLTRIFGSGVETRLGLEGLKMCIRDRSDRNNGHRFPQPLQRRAAVLSTALTLTDHQSYHGYNPLKMCIRDRDMYQQSMSAGNLIEDFHRMLTGDDEKTRYLYRLE